MNGSGPCTAAAVVATLRAHRRELRAAGIRHLSLYGSVARAEAGSDSDIDLAVELEGTPAPGLFALVALQRRLTELLGRPADLTPEPVASARLKAHIDRDRHRVF